MTSFSLSCTYFVCILVLCSVPCCCCCWVASITSDSVQPHRWLPTRLLFPGILQVRILEWVAISFSVACCGQLSVTLWTVVHQVLLSMEFPRQEYWSGVPFPTPGDLPNPGTETHVSYVSCIGRWVPYHCTTSILIKAEIYLSQLWIWIIACSLYLLIRHYPEKSGVGLIQHCFSQNSSSSDSR